MSPSVPEMEGIYATRRNPFFFLFFLRMYLWWSLCTLYLLACQVKVITCDSGLCCCFQDIPLVEFMYLIFTRMPSESYRRQLKSLLLCLCDVFRVLINSLVCWFSTSAPDLFCFRVCQLQFVLVHCVQCDPQCPRNSQCKQTGATSTSEALRANIQMNAAFQITADYDLSYEIAVAKSHASKYM